MSDHRPATLYAPQVRNAYVRLERTDIVRHSVRGRCVMWRCPECGHIVLAREDINGPLCCPMLNRHEGIPNGQHRDSAERR